MAGLLRNESKAFHWLIPCQERSRVFVLPVSLCHCNCIYQNYQRFSTGYNGITKELCRGDGCSLSGEMLFCLEQHRLLHWHLNSLGRCYLHMFSSVSRGQYWDGTLLVFGHTTRKWQSPDSNTGRFPTEAYHVQFFSHYIFFRIVEKSTQHKIYHLDPF